MTRDEMIEVMARAIDAEIDTSELLLTDPMTLRKLKASRVSARALSALEAAGYVVVPKEPTDEMIEAGCAAPDDDDYASAMAKAYSAMTAAAQQEKTDAG